MLNDFFSFVEEHKHFKWIHWNMRNINYGFEALEHRVAILGGEHCTIKDENKYDLARLLKDKYGDGYSNHPRLQSILEMNDISSKHWLSGDKEAIAFDNKEYVMLHQSTLSKVAVFESIIKLTAEERLNTKSKLKDIYGISPQGLFELIKDHWIYSLIIFIISVFLGAYLGKII